MNDDWQLLATKKEISALESRCDLLNLFRSGAVKTQQELVSLYERRLTACQEETSKALAAAAKAETHADTLRQHNEQLQLTIATLNVRLEAAISGKQEDEGNQQQQQEDATTIDGTHGHSTGRLVSLMLAYERGRDKEKYASVYDELFQLREEHVKVIAQNTNMRAAHQHLQQAHADTQRRLAHAHDQCEVLNKEIDASKQHARQVEQAHAEQQDQIKQVRTEMHALQRQKDDLQSALQVTAFQLREMLRAVEFDKSLLPPSIKSSDDLFQYAANVTDADPDLVVYRDIDELQQKNQNLIVELQRLTGALRDKTGELDTFKSQSAADAREHDRKLQEAYHAIADLKAALSVHTIHRSGLPEEFGESIAAKVKVGRELQQLEDTLAQAQQEAHDATMQWHQAKAEAEHYKHQAVSYESTSNTRLAELSKMQAAHAHLEQQLSSARRALDHHKDDLATLRRTNATLDSDLSAVRKQMAQYERLYSEAAAEKEIRGHKIDELTALVSQQESTWERKLAALTDFNDHLKSVVADHEKSIDELQQELQSAKQQLQQQAAAAAAAATAGNDNNHPEAKEEQEEYWSPMEEIKRLERENIRLAKELAEVNERHAVLEAKMASYEQERDPERLAQFEKDAADLVDARTQLELLRQQVRNYEEQMRISEDEIAKSAQERRAFVDDMTAKLHAQQQQLDDYRSREKAMETSANEIQRIKDDKAEAEKAWLCHKKALADEISGLRAKLKAQEDRVHQLQDEMDTQVTVVKEVQQQLERAKAELEEKGEAQTDTTATSTQEAEQLTNALAQAKQQLAAAQAQATSAQATLADQKTHWEDMISTLRAEVETARSETLELKARLASFATEGDGALPAAAAPVLAIEAVPEDKVRQFATTLQKQHNELLAKSKEIEVQREQLQRDLETAQQELALLKSQLEILRADSMDKQSQQDATLKSLVSEASAYKDSNTRLRSALKEVENECKTLKERVSQKIASPTAAPTEETQAPPSTKEADQQQQQQQQEQQQQQAAANAAELEDIKNKIEQLEKSNAELKKELGTANANTKKFQSMAAGLKKRWDLAQEQLKQAKAKSKQQQQEEGGAEQKIQSIEESLQKVTQEREQLEAKYEHLRQASTTLQNNYNKLLHNSRKLLVDKAKAEKEVAELKKRVSGQTPGSPAGVKRATDENAEGSKSPKTPKTQ